MALDSVLRADNNKALMKNSSQVLNRTLFLLLAAIEIAHLIYLILSHRIPLGHDGFQYFTLEYFFLNDTAVNNEVPLWVPYMNHGLTASWFYTIQGSVGLLANALFLAGKAIASINFQNIFHYGIFVDRMILLTGVWLLAQRYFDSAWTRFFTASCIMGSTVTMTQFNFTLHLYFAIPLLLYFVHTFLDTGLWRYFFLACNLLMIQTFGKNADTFTIVSLTAFLYFLFYALDQPAYFAGQIRKLRWGFPSAAGIIGGLSSLGVMAMTFTAGRDPAMVNLNFGRSLDSSVPLNIFLTYAGNMDFHKWQELILRRSPSLDFTIYMGFIALPLVLIGLFYHQNRIKFPLVLVSLLLLFFSMGTWVSVFFYYAWPMMKFYRHLSLIVPLIKLFLIFLAGFGFEKLFILRETWQGKRDVSYICLLSGALLLVTAAILIQMSCHGAQASHYIVRFLTVQTSQTPATFDAFSITFRLIEASFYALLAGIIFLVLPLVPFKKYGTTMILAVLIINAGDIYGYYCTEINERTFALNKDQYQITAFSPTPYASRRVISAVNPRQKILLSPAGQHTLYVTVNAFLFQDALATPYRTIERMKPFHDMITAFGKDVLKNPAFLKIAGSSVDKVQFFDQACLAHDDKQLSSFLTDPKFRGDLLFVSGAPAGSAPACSPHMNLKADHRIDAHYQITHFTPNTLELSADVPAVNPVWMLYADVWHPGWKALVNGKPAAVLKADMAYKAVLLPPGKSRIQFIFTSSKLELLEKVIAVNALLWLFILMYLLAGVLKLKPREEV
jgi:hypothetical protein